MRNCCAVLFLWVFLVGAASAQTFGDISGEVTDPSGSIIPGANVTLTNLGTGGSRATTANEAGLYRFPSLAPGMYSVRIEAEGFRASVRTDIELQVQQSARVDFSLQVGEVAEVVEVSADAMMLSTDSTVGSVIEQKRIVDLPLNGRNFLQLVSLSPNVTFGFSTPGQAAGRQGGTRTEQNISVSGMRGTFNYYTLDGIANTDINFNLYAVLPSVDALQEFKVQSGVYPAEFGRAATQINVSTKAGGNDFHGTAYWFHRNSAVDANPYDFDGTQPQNLPFRWNQYGATVSGPAIKNKLFFMANYEGFKQRRALETFGTTATAAQRAGDFSAVPNLQELVDPLNRAPFPNRRIPVTRFHPTANRLLEFWPEPNVPTAALFRNFQRTQRNTVDNEQLTLRVDFNESSSSQWFGRYSWTDEGVFNDGLFLNGSTLLTAGKQYMVSNTRVLSPTKVNELRFGMNVLYNEVGQELGGVRNVVEELGLPFATDPPSSWGIPAITVTTYSAFGNGANGPFVIDNKIFQVLDNFSWVAGKHSIRFGGEYRYDIYDQIGNEFARGRFSHDGRYSGEPAADLLLGAMWRAEAAIALAESQFRAHNVGLYIDDSYRMTSKLTFNVGLRWEFFQPFKDKTQTMINSIVPVLSDIPNDPNINNHPLAVRPGTGDFYEGRDFRYVTNVNGVATPIRTLRDGSMGERIINNDWNNFAPRFGIAYSPTDRWAIRTGFGIFYSAESGNSRFDMNRAMGGRLDRIGSGPGQVPNTTWENFLDPSQLPVRVPNAYLWGVIPEIGTSYSMMYLFNIQRTLGRNSMFEISYNGVQHRKLQVLQNRNAPLPGTANINLRRPYPAYGIQQIVVNGGRGSYNGLGMKLTHRASNNLTAMLSYTWSKALDTGSAIRGTSNDIFPQDDRCLRCEFGHSAYDTPHRMVLSSVWTLPFGSGQRFANQGGALNRVVGGWEIGTIMTIQSGRPINSMAGYDAPGIGTFGSARLNTIGKEPNLPSGQRNADTWFDRSAFFYTAPGTFGNIARNRLTGPSQFLWDLSLMKSVPIIEGHRLQLRFEAFNFPNHPVLGNPGAAWGPNATTPQPAFGRIRSTATQMRQVQFGVKYIF